jgi:hypothetical protein
MDRRLHLSKKESQELRPDLRISKKDKDFMWNISASRDAD